MLLRDFRVKKNLTQKDIAKMLQISVRQYQNFEAGTSYPREPKQKQLEDIFQVPYRVLFSRSEDEIPDFLKRFLP